MSKDDGGPAFPSKALDPDMVELLKDAREREARISVTDIRRFSRSPGMTLRDYFAAQALVWSGKICDRFGNTDNPRLYAEYAYKVADAMLAHRTRDQDGEG